LTITAGAPIAAAANMEPSNNATGDVRSRRLRNITFAKCNDVAISRITATVAGLRGIVLNNDRFVLLIPRSWPDSVGPQTLSNEPWVWIPHRISPDYHDQVLACCTAEGLSPNRRHTARSITTQLAMVGAGVGVAIVPLSNTAREEPLVHRHDLRTHQAAIAGLTVSYRDVADALVDGFVAVCGGNLS
jgi:DNA-binding transcriptional LysR family regulator